MKSLATVALTAVFALPGQAQQNAPDPHTRVAGIFETVCLRGAQDFSDNHTAFFAAGLEPTEEGYWLDSQNVIIGAAGSSDGNEQHICSVGLVQGDAAQFAEVLPNLLDTVWADPDMRRFEGSAGRSDIYMTENAEGIRAAWVDTSEGNVAVLMTSFTRKDALAK